MRRFIYICLLRLHPRRFRRRFGDEMLWIFDQAGAGSRAASLFADVLASLGRQWVLRSQFWQEPLSAQPAVDGVPSFYMGGGDRPRTSALIHGGVLSLIVFGTVCYILAHSNSHGRFLLIGSHNHSFSHFLETRSVSAAPTDLGAQIKIKPEPEAHRASPYFRLMPVLRALDADNDGVISSAEIANAAVTLLTLDNNHDNKLSAEECGLGAPNPTRAIRRSFMRLHPVLAALDANHDGEISAAEILNAPAALRSLDKNGDGVLTEDELLPDAAANNEILRRRRKHK